METPRRPRHKSLIPSDARGNVVDVNDVGFFELLSTTQAWEKMTESIEDCGDLPNATWVAALHYGMGYADLKPLQAPA